MNTGKRCSVLAADQPVIDNAPAPPNMTASAINKSASVYSTPLPLPGP